MSEIMYFNTENGISLAIFAFFPREITKKSHKSLRKIKFLTNKSFAVLYSILMSPPPPTKGACLIFTSVHFAFIMLRFT